MFKKTVYLSSFPVGQPKLFDLDESNAWLAELLSELNEEMTAEELASLDEKFFLCFEGEGLRTTTGKLEDHVKIQGKISTVYATRCINTGKPMVDSLDLEVKFVVIDDELISRYGYEEQTTIFIDDSEFELYSTKDNRFDIKEIIHEFLWLNKDQYPTTLTDTESN